MADPGLKSNNIWGTKLDFKLIGKNSQWSSVFDFF